MRRWTGSALVQVMAWRQCCLIVNWTLGNTIQLNLNRNKKRIHQITFESVVCEIATILFRGRWVKKWLPVQKKPQNFDHVRNVSANGRSYVMYFLSLAWALLTWQYLTHWGRVTHISVGNLTIIGADNGLAPGRPQAIIQTNAGIFLIGPLGTNFSEILIGIQTFSIKKMHLKMSSAKWRPFCPGLNVLKWLGTVGID